MIAIIRKRLISVMIVVFSLWCVYSWANPTDIRLTEYTYKTDKVSQDYKILFISDSHYGAVQDKEVLKRTLNEIDSVDADIVILGGDIVERGTSYEDAQEVFKMFGSLSNKFGVFYVYGNHDYEMYERTKVCSKDEFIGMLMDNGIQLLCEDAACLNNDIMLIGRDDLSHVPVGIRERVSSVTNIEFMECYYKIVVDHQPINMIENSEDGVDMQISGHTHAGQIFPINLLFTYHGWPVYGQYDYDGMKLVISSGQGVGSYACRNLKHCEYVVINLLKED